jgi:hypothetical protein
VARVDGDAKAVERLVDRVRLGAEFGRRAKPAWRRRGVVRRREVKRSAWNRR